MSVFNSNIIATINYIECPVEIATDTSKSFAGKVEGWKALGTKVHALDFRATKKVSPSFYQQIWMFHKGLKEKGLRLVSINISSTLESQLKRDGVLEQFGFVRDFQTMVQGRAVASSPEEIRQTLVKYLVEAARRAMETLFSVTVAADENFVENARDFKLDKFHRAATMTVKSAILNADFRLYFPEDTLFNLTSRMVGDAYTDEETLNSTATELLNMIYGGAKSYLNDEKSFNLPPAIPTLVLKEQIAELKRSENLRSMVCIPLASPLGTYHLEIDFG